MFDTQKKNQRIMQSHMLRQKKDNGAYHELKNRISSVVGIPIFGFNKYWKRLFNFIEIKITPTFKLFLQSETFNSERNKSYYQRYDVKILRAFHKQEMIKQKIYENILARKSGMDYSPGIQFQTNIINMDKAKSLTMKNQPGK